MTRSQMRRQLYRGGGIATLPRQNYGIGSIVQDLKDKTVERVRKIIPNELADVATKAAPFIAPFNPLAAGIMRGVGRLDQRGNLTDALKQGLLTYGGGQLMRHVGGAGMQTGFNPMSGMEGMKYGLSPPLGGWEGSGGWKGKAKELAFGKPESIQRSMAGGELRAHTIPVSYTHLTLPTIYSV